MQRKHLNTEFSSWLIILIYLSICQFLSCKMRLTWFYHRWIALKSYLHVCIQVTLIYFFFHSVCEIPHRKNQVWYISWNFDQEICGAFEEFRRWCGGSESSCWSFGSSKAKNLWHYQCPRGCWINQKEIQEQHWMEVSDLEQIFFCHVPFTPTSFVLLSIDKFIYLLHVYSLLCYTSFPFYPKINVSN